MARQFFVDEADFQLRAHSGTDGSTRLTRALEAGYVGRPNTRVRENLLGGAASPVEVFEVWKSRQDPNDPFDHNDQMSDCGYDAVGVGYARVDGSQFGHYWTAEFGVRP